VYLTSDEIKSLIQSQKIVEGVENLDDNLEGGALDLCVEQLRQPDIRQPIDVIFRPLPVQMKSDVPIIGQQMIQIPVLGKIGPKRVTPKTVEVTPTHHGDWVLYGQQFYYMTTKESFNTPDWLRPVLGRRKTTIIDCLCIIFAPIHPGYHGVITFGCYVCCPIGTAIALTPGSRVITVMFEELKGRETKKYEGIWQGGRISTEGQEERPY